MRTLWPFRGSTFDPTTYTGPLTAGTLAVNGRQVAGMLEQISATSGNFTVLPGVTLFRTSESHPGISTAITLTLAAASSYKAGQRVVISDSAVALNNSTGRIAIGPAGADTIFTGSPVMSLGGGFIELESDGVSNWSFIAASEDLMNSLGIIPSTIIFNVLQIANLPASPVTGQMCIVSDALAPTYGATVVAGGAAVVPVLYNGSAWKVH